MANFDTYYPKILFQNEGGYADDPNDQGKETYFGISRVFNPHWSGWPYVDKIRLRFFPGTSAKHPVPRKKWPKLTKLLLADKLLRAKTRNLYKPEYWDALGLDLVNSVSVAYQLVDFAVNSGVGVSAKTARYVLHTKFGAQLADVADDQLSVHSLAAAINAVDARTFYQDFVAIRAAYYNFLAGTQYSHVQEQALAPWHTFFRHQLGVAPDRARDNRYLHVWLKRTYIPFRA